jgi:hypothetical protein
MGVCEVAAPRSLPPAPPFPRQVEAAHKARLAPEAVALANLLGPASSLSAIRLKPPRGQSPGIIPSPTLHLATQAGTEILL